MATKRFKEVSPYTKKSQEPSEDFLYKKYMEDLGADNIKTQHKSTVKLALFGIGRAGTIHLASIISNPRVKLSYIVDAVEHNLQRTRLHWHLEDVTFLNCEQSDKVFEDPDVDAIIVASPTFTHEDIVIKALKARKAVFCEKPIAENRTDTAKCYEIAKTVDRPLFCAFNRRFDPGYSTVRDRVHRGEVGHVHLIKTVSRDCPLPSIGYLKISGGIFHDCLVHDIDIITWTLGEYPIKVAVQAHAHIPEIKEINDFDTVAVILYFPSGTLGLVELSRNSVYGYDQRLEVFGPKGMVQADNERPMNFISTLNGRAPIWYSFASRFMNGYRNEFNHFIDVVLGKTECSVKSKEVLAISKIATACEESARTGMMVQLKWEEGELPY